MFTVIFHDEAEKEFTALPAAIRAKNGQATHEAGSKPSPATRARYCRLETAFSKYVQWGRYRPRNLGDIRVVNVFFYFDLYQKIAKNAPGRNRSGTSQTGGNAE